ncbi:hypothetical protein [Swingsia samuiensis]|uniref:Uncharacterized protein n=1 Tax=Swingsia samuiensis TaxID=1293412 RepID=A0A4Y6UL72_9PROT|nr:hypothetical protein [Swingsia samuiensis]QDH17388.1 hypothetical protein E3D00_07295 [Swingsia samuiensis]
MPNSQEFQYRQTIDMQDIQFKLAEQKIRQDQSEKRLDNIESAITVGFKELRQDLLDTRADLGKIRTWRTWITFATTIGGSAAGSAIWHALQAGVHP